MELRKDYILDRWVIIAEGRGKRPHEFKIEESVYANDKGPSSCFFCPGNEGLTPPEMGRTKDTKGWKMRWFENKFNAVDRKGSPSVRTDNTFFTFSDAYGSHMVVTETPEHDKQMTDLTVDDLVQLLKVYSQRIDEMINQPNIKYVSVFKNQGKMAGTSIIHSHSQIISLNIVPPAVREKIEAMKRYPACPYCSIIEIERKSFRHVYENDTCVAFTPYASRFNFETWIFPKNHYRSMMDFSDDELFDMASAIKKVLMKMKELNAPFNMALFYAPKGEDLHLHIEILPRISVFAGFEYASGVYINSVSPEAAASFMKGEHKESNK